jgi:AraC family ethanolamine operon transcriptional activator
MIDRQDFNFEEFDAEIESVNGRTTLLGREESAWKIHTWSYADIILQGFQEGGANSYVAAGNEDFFSLGIGLPGPSVICTNGVEMNPGQMVLLRPGRDVVTHSHGICRYAVLSIPRKQFFSLLEDYDPSQMEELLNGSTGIAIGHQRTKALMDIINRLMGDGNEGGLLHDSSAQTAAAEELSSAFVRAALSTLPVSNISNSCLSRRMVTNSIVELLRSPEHFSLSIPEMAKLANVPERTFRLICTERFGMSPRRLFMLRQYDNVRRDLLHASKSENVSQIASRHGIWEWGRFAVRYRRIYSESPSETLARRAGATARPVGFK